MNRKFRNKLIASLVAPAIALSLAGMATAADPAKPGTMAMPGDASKPTMATPANAAKPMAPASNTAQQSFRDMRASKLIGSDVRNAEGENLGEIKDLIVDVSNQRVHYAVLSFGGFLGLGDKLFAYPVSAFKQVGNEDKVILNVDKAKLKAAPGFDSKLYPDFNAPKYRTDVDRYFGSSAAVKSMPNQTLRRASELLGKDINDRNGKDVGEIEDLVVSMGNGKVRYAVVEFDKAWNLNDKLLAVPLKAFRFTTDGKDLVWDIDKSKVDAALTFDKSRWPDLNDPKYLVDTDNNLVRYTPTAAVTTAANATGHVSTFDRLDTDRDNMLSVAEVRKNAAVHGMWKQLDANNDGNVSRNEFAANPKAMALK